MRGVMSLLSSIPSPTFMSLTMDFILSVNSSTLEEEIRNLSLHTQVWPEFLNLLLTAASTAVSMSASSKTTNGAFPPNSNDILLTIPPSPHWECRILPTRVEPVNDIFFMSSSLHTTSPKPSLPPGPKGSTSKIPSSTPASLPNSLNAMAVIGVSSLGFKTLVQPAAIAGPTFLVIIASGKFHGVMKAQGPTGSLKFIIVPLLALDVEGKGEGIIVPPDIPDGRRQVPA
mmetsp:Transcript_23166/g.48050  ORF Transcript_23166/g.48050 Transcript_23166/m.48050 type:complete len:229 (-) Transcript_23166:492-1178(-)